MIFAVLMSLTMVLTYMPAIAFAAPDGDVDADNGSAVEEVTYDPGVVVTDIEGDLADNDELLEGYLEQQISGGNADGLGKAGKIDRGSKLTGNNKAIYDLLRPEIEKIASGERTDATIVLPLKAINPSVFKTKYTKEDLGAKAIVVDGQFTPEALDAMYELYSYNLNEIISALMADLPYEMYWYYKIWGLATEDPDIRARFDGQDWYAFFAGDNPSFTFYFSGSVNGAYEYKDENGVLLFKDPGFQGKKVKDLPLTESDGTQTVRPLYEVNTSVVGTAIQNAKNVISDNKGKTDLQKLTGYRDYICAANEYNGPAADSAQDVYGNPWQMIWVFDNDSSTNVVCEGYSKAFKYLCDGSEFTNIACYTVTGSMNGGKHMWNIVNMEDDKNYLVDVTNCDDGSAGGNNGKHDGLFLKGNASGSPGSQYVFEVGGQNITYCYDTRTKEHSLDILTLASKDYEDTEWVTVELEDINLQPGEEYIFNSRVEAVLKSNNNMQGDICEFNLDYVPSVLAQVPDKADTKVIDVTNVTNENNIIIGGKITALNFGTAILEVLLTDKNDEDIKYCCNVLVNVSKDKHVHSWGAWKKTENADLDEPATETRECTVCHKKQTRYTGKTLREVEAEKVAAAQAAAAAKAEAERLEWEGTLSSKVPAAKSVKAKVSKKKVTVSWKKLSTKQLKKFSKVEIQISKKKSFRKADGTIRKMVKKTKKSQKITLKKKGTYYVRVRNVKGSGTTKRVSKWSKPKKIKIK